jgi:hypothetical protein
MRHGVLLFQGEETSTGNTAMHPNYSKYIIGTFVVAQPIIFRGDANCTVSIEQFADGFHWYVQTSDGKYTNHKGYKSAKGAILAAARAK